MNLMNLLDNCGITIQFEIMLIGFFINTFIWNPKKKFFFFFDDFWSYNFCVHNSARQFR